MLSLSVEGSGVNNRVLCYDYAEGEWFFWDNIPAPQQATPAQVAALTAERDAAVNVRNEALRDCNAALVRAEAAEAERDAARDAMFDSNRVLHAALRRAEAAEARIAAALALRVKPWLTYTAEDGHLSSRTKDVDEIAAEYAAALVGEPTKEESEK